MKEALFRFEKERWSWESYQLDQWSPLRTFWRFFSLGDYFLRWNKGGDRWTRSFIWPLLDGNKERVRWCGWVWPLTPLFSGNSYIFLCGSGYPPSHPSKPTNQPTERTRYHSSISRIYSISFSFSPLSTTDATLPVSCKIFLALNLNCCLPVATNNAPHSKQSLCIICFWYLGAAANNSSLDSFIHVYLNI